jgi:hypothetical protein
VNGRFFQVDDWTTVNVYGEYRFQKVNFWMTRASASAPQPLRQGPAARLEQFRVLRFAPQSDGAVRLRRNRKDFLSVDAAVETCGAALRDDGMRRRSSRLGRSAPRQHSAPVCDIRLKAGQEKRAPFRMTQKAADRLPYQRQRPATTNG